MTGKARREEQKEQEGRAGGIDVLETTMVCNELSKRLSSPVTNRIFCATATKAESSMINELSFAVLARVQDARRTSNIEVPELGEAVQGG